MYFLYKGQRKNHLQTKHFLSQRRLSSGGHFCSSGIIYYPFQKQRNRKGVFIKKNTKQKFCLSITYYLQTASKYTHTKKKKSNRLFPGYCHTAFVLSIGKSQTLNTKGASHFFPAHRWWSFLSIPRRWHSLQGIKGMARDRCHQKTVCSKHRTGRNKLNFCVWSRINFQTGYMFIAKAFLLLHTAW